MDVGAMPKWGRRVPKNRRARPRAGTATACELLLSRGLELIGQVVDEYGSR
jgi:hypothetical protein